MKNKQLIFLLLPLVVCILYTGLWFGMKSHIEEHIAPTLANAEKEGLNIIGDIPPISGFPGAYTINFTGTIEYQGLSLTIQDMAIKSFFLPQTKLSIYAPHGVVVHGTGDPDLDSLHMLSITARIPQTLPDEFSNHTMQQWHAHNGKLEVISYEIQKETLHIKGAGVLQLDEELQPRGKFSTHITGILPFIEWLKDKEVIETKDVMISKAVLSALLKEHPDNGEKTLDAELNLQNRTLFLGPLRLLRLPLIHWEPEGHPVLPQ